MNARDRLVSRPDDGKARRREIRREGRQAAIIAVAQRHFADYGFGGASMSAIAADVGGSKATLWTYFPSKEALFVASFSAWINEIEPVRSLRSQGDLRRRLIDQCADFAAVMLSPIAETIFRLTAAEGWRFPELGRTYYRRVPLRHHMLLADLLEHEIRAGGLRAADSLRAAEQLHNTCMCRLLFRRVCGLDLDRSADEAMNEVVDAVDVFLDGCASRPESV